MNKQSGTNNETKPTHLTRVFTEKECTVLTMKKYFAISFENDTQSYDFIIVQIPQTAQRLKDHLTNILTRAEHESLRRFINAEHYSRDKANRPYLKKVDQVTIGEIELAEDSSNVRTTLLEIMVGDEAQRFFSICQEEIQQVVTGKGAVDTRSTIETSLELQENLLQRYQREAE